MRNWTLWEKYFENKKCPDTLLFFIILGMFRRNFTRIGQIYICYKFAQSERTPQNQLRDFSS